MRVLIVDRRTKDAMAAFSRANPDALCFAIVPRENGQYRHYFVARNEVVVEFPTVVHKIILSIASGLGRVVSTRDIFYIIYGAREDGGPLFINSFVRTYTYVHYDKLSLLNIAFLNRKGRGYEIVDLAQTKHLNAAE